VLTNPATGASKGSGFAFVTGKANAETLMYIFPSLQRCRVLVTGFDVYIAACFVINALV
jgi:hypothetical protein